MQRKPLRKLIPKGSNDPSRVTPCCMIQAPMKTIKKSNKQNSQKAFFMQNQCQILKLKGRDIEISLNGLKQQLIQLQDNKRILQKQCLSIQKQIQNLEDGRIPQFKTSILKLQMVHKNKNNEIQEWQSKIMSIKKKIEEQSFYYQQQAVKSQTLEIERWRIHSENQGMKNVKSNLEDEIDDLNRERNRLNMNNIEYQPEQEKMNSNIQNTIKQVNVSKQSMREKLAILTTKSLTKIMTRIKRRLLSDTLQTCIINIDEKRLKKKTLYNIMCIHQKYLDRVKQKYLERFKRLINHTEQETRLIRALNLLYNNNKKYRVVSLWKKQFMKIQFSQIRKQQTISSLVSILQSMQKSLVYCQFNQWKHWTEKIRKGGRMIKGIVSLFQKKKIRKAFSNIIQYSRRVQLDENEDQHCYKKQSFKIIRKYFKAWSHHLESVKLSSKVIKHKTFNILKQNQKESKRNKYLEMIHLIIKKNNMTKLLMKSFYGLQMSTKLEKIQERNTKGEQIQSLIEKQSVLNIKQINKKKIKCRQIGVSRLSTFMSSLIRSSFDKVKQVYSISLKLNSFEHTLKRTIQSDYLSKSFRNIMIASSLSSHLSTRLEIDSHTQSIKSRISQLDVLKSEQKTININCASTGKQYIMKWMQGIYQRLMAYSFLNIQKHRITRTQLLLSAKRIGTITKKLLVKSIFYELRYFSIAQNTQQSNQMKVETFLQKKRKFIKKQFLSQLSKQSSRNILLKKTVKRAIKSLKLQSLTFGFQRLKINRLLQNNLKLKQTQNKLFSLLNEVQLAVKNKKQKALNKIFELRSQIVRTKAYEQRYHINSLTKIIKNPASSAIQVWHKSLLKQKSIWQFLQRTNKLMQRAILKKGFQQFFANCYRIMSNQQIAKYNRIVLEYENNSKKAQTYSDQLQKLISLMRQQSLTKSEQIEYYNKLITNFEAIKLSHFAKKSNNKLLSNIFYEWRIESQQRKVRLSRFVSVILYNQCKEPFELLQNNRKQERRVYVLKMKLVKYIQKYQQNNYKDVLIKWNRWKNSFRRQELKKQMLDESKLQNTIQSSIQNLQEKYQQKVILHFNNFNKKKFLNIFAKITKEKILQKQLTIETRAVYKKIICKKALIDISMNQSSTKYYKKCNSQIESNSMIRILRQSFIGWKQCHLKLQKFNKLFLQEYIFYNIKSYQADFFRNVKLSAQQNKVKKVQKSSTIINKLVVFYQNLSLTSLQKGFFKWRINMKTISNRKQFLKRILKKAHSNRIYHAWNLWKLQSNARHVQYYHQTQGEIKIKQNQYQRIRKYINQFKQMKGLVVFQGNQLISSPRYQLKQQTQNISYNNKKYQLLSKLILFQNQQLDKIHTWNSLKYSCQLSEQLRIKSLFVHNMMRNSDKYTGFRKWREQIKLSKQRLNRLDKNQLIDEIKCIQQKVEILNSSKYQLKEEMIIEVKRTELIHKHINAKQVLSKILVFRAGERLQRQAISRWHSVSRQVSEKQAQTIQLMALRRIEELSKELESLEYSLTLSLNLNEQLKGTAMEGIEIAETLKYLTNQRDELNQQIKQQSLTCEALSEENIVLQQRFNLAQKEAYQLLSLARD